MFYLFVHTTALCLYIYILYIYIVWSTLAQDLNPVPPPAGVATALEVITYIGLVVSILSLLLMIVTYFCSKWDWHVCWVYPVHYSSRVPLINVASSLINIASCQRSVSVEYQLSTKILHTFLIIIIIITYCLCWFWTWSPHVVTNTCQHTCRDV